ncbi:hypothetical protein BJY04DRAFT_192751, partial [Aspergillus karnatakaensis]|uniref:EGFR-like transmembrane domain-containing protein n=1 Tax=Aspergillus karnatakaensis TaxID=1810916 RepID=UPI003CCE2CC2
MATPTESVSHNGSSDSLTGGAIAGITVGAVAGVALLIVGAFVLFKRHRRQQKLASRAPAAELSPDAQPKQQLFEVDGSGTRERPPQELL